MRNLQKVEDIKTPLTPGAYYLVPCFIKRVLADIPNPEWEFIHGEPRFITQRMERQVFPVINHPHNDRENGQAYTHYHVDYRFYDPTIKSRDKFCPDSRFNMSLQQALSEGWAFEYHALRCVSAKQVEATGALYIKNSKLKHDCIYKGKCPHRGYDLSQVAPVNGVITCPLHGLKFDAETKKRIA